MEHRGEWPPGAPAPRTGALFGCDACTAVCPFNPRQAADAWPEFLPGPDSAPTAAECLAMEPGEFKRRFRDTAVFRSGLDRLRRNAQAVLQAGAPPTSGKTAGAPYRGSAGGRPSA